MRPPFAYFGGKARLAAHIAGLLPAHRIYVEPFAGSLAVLLTKQRSHLEVVGDLDGDVATWWRVLRDRPEELIEAIRLTPYAREEYDLAWEPTDDELERARRFWIRITQGIGAKLHPKPGWQCSPSDGRQGIARTRYLARKVEGLVEVAGRLSEAMIENRPAHEVVERLDGPDTVHYLDPPYVRSTRSRGWDGYRHGMTDAEHRDLAGVLASARGTVLISGYPSALYDAELFAGWERIELDGRADTASRRGGEHHRVEVLWSNRPLREQLRLGEVPA